MDLPGGGLHAQIRSLASAQILGLDGNIHLKIHFCAFPDCDTFKWNKIWLKLGRISGMKTSSDRPPPCYQSRFFLTDY